MTRDRLKKFDIVLPTYSLITLADLRKRTDFEAYKVIFFTWCSSYISKESRQATSGEIQRGHQVAIKLSIPCVEITNMIHRWIGKTLATGCIGF